MGNSYDLQDHSWVKKVAIQACLFFRSSIQWLKDSQPPFEMTWRLMGFHFLDSLDSEIFALHSQISLATSSGD